MRWDFPYQTEIVLNKNSDSGGSGPGFESDSIYCFLDMSLL